MNYEAVISDTYVSKGYQVLFFDDDILEFPAWSHVIIDGETYAAVLMEGFINTIMIKTEKDVDYKGHTAQFIK